MLRVAVTGGIGSGKSTLAAEFAACGAVVIDSDRLAREAVAPGTPGLAAIARRFGRSVLTDSGQLNRPALAALVFADPAARRDLEAVTHPAVRARFAELAAAAAPGSIVVNDIPLLTDLATAASFHLVVGVGANVDVRVSRLAGRGVAESDARARIAAQIDDLQRRPLTDVWLTNDGDHSELISAADALWRRRLLPFNQRLVDGAPLPGPHPIVGPADPEWSTATDRLTARVVRAVGAASETVEHIGPTAVPGLPAPDLIELQVGVRSAVLIEQAGRSLTGAGFVALAGSTDMWVNADPGRPATVAVRTLADPAWRRTRMLRDWLRADRAARIEYLEHQPVGAAASGTGATDSWWERAAQRAEAWASAGGWNPR